MSVAVPLDETRLYTAEDLMDMPSDARFELIDGRLVAMSPTKKGHGFVTSDLSTEIAGFVRQNNLGRCTAAETGFLLARQPDVVLAPDFAFISHARLSADANAQDDEYITAVPDLVIETRSPSDRSGPVAEKIRRWLSYGVTVVIDANPKQKTLTVHRSGTEPIGLGIRDTLELPNILPGFALPLSQVF